MSFLKNVLKETSNEYGTIASDGLTTADVSGYVDTGSFVFNALVSGSLYGGLPQNKITALAGESATGKTFFVLGVVKAFLESDPKAQVVFFESESAITRDMFEARDIDTSRIALLPVTTVQEFRYQALATLEAYEQEENRPPILMCLDSLGMLSTTKEMTDTAEGKETRDMTRAQIVKATFRVLTLKLGKLGVPLIMTNHTYDVVGSMFPQKEMGGGSGLKYAASQIIYLSKKKDKDGTEVIGNIIHCKTYKSRLTKENQMVDVRLSYTKGLDRHYGLLYLAVEAGIFKAVSTRIELPDGTKTFGKTINNDPEKYYTDEVMEKLDTFAKEKFCYG